MSSHMSAHPHTVSTPPVAAHLCGQGAEGPAYQDQGISEGGGCICLIPCARHARGSARSPHACPCHSPPHPCGNLLFACCAPPPPQPLDLSVPQSLHLVVRASPAASTALPAAATSSGSSGPSSSGAVASNVPVPPMAGGRSAAAAAQRTFSTPASAGPASHAPARSNNSSSADHPPGVAGAAPLPYMPHPMYGSHMAQGGGAANPLAAYSAAAAAAAAAALGQAAPGVASAAGAASGIPPTPSDTAGAAAAMYPYVYVNPVMAAAYNAAYSAALAAAQGLTVGSQVHQAGAAGAGSSSSEAPQSAPAMPLAHPFAPMPFALYYPPFQVTRLCLCFLQNLCSSPDALELCAVRLCLTPQSPKHVIAFCRVCLAMASPWACRQECRPAHTGLLAPTAPPSPLQCRCSRSNS